VALLAPFVLALMAWPTGANAAGCHEPGRPTIEGQLDFGHESPSRLDPSILRPFCPRESPIATASVVIEPIAPIVSEDEPPGDDRGWAVIAPEEHHRPKFVPTSIDRPPRAA
jgi:hypothetical protein